MRNLFTISVITFLTFGALGQIDQEKFEQKMLMKDEGKEYSWAQKNLFLDGKYSAVAEIFIVPRIEYKYLDYSYSVDPDTITLADNGFLISIGSIALEPRVNLLSTRKSALYLKAPLAFALSVTTGGDMRNKRSGFFHVNAPILLGYARGLNSSYQNASHSGFAISAGYQFLLAPLTGGETNYFTEIYDQSELKPLGDPYEQRKKFGMPIVQLDYYKLKRNHKISGFALAFCPYGNIYFKLAMNFAISKK